MPFAMARPAPPTLPTPTAIAGVILGVLWITHRRLPQPPRHGPLGAFFKEDLGITSAEVGLVAAAAWAT